MKRLKNKNDMDERLKELGWTPVTEELPPLGVRVNVCRVDGFTQGVWVQEFKTVAEIKSSGITHWGK